MSQQQKATIADTEKRVSVPMVASLLVLTVVTGVIDAVSYLGLGRIMTANMTGNVLFLAFALAGAPGLSARRGLFSLFGFLAGAIASGRIHIAMTASGNLRRWIWIAVSAEAALLFGAAVVSNGLSPGINLERTRLVTVIVVAAMAMGLRNATIRQLGVPDMTTTVLTLTLSGLAADSSLTLGGSSKIARRGASILFMFAGAVFGTFLLRFGLALPLALSGVAVLATAWPIAASQEIE